MRKTDFYLNLCFRRWFCSGEIKYGALFSFAGHSVHKKLYFSLYDFFMLRWCYEFGFFRKILLRFIDLIFFCYLDENPWQTYEALKPTAALNTVKLKTGFNCQKFVQVDFRFTTNLNQLEPVCTLKQAITSVPLSVLNQTFIKFRFKSVIETCRHLTHASKPCEKSFTINEAIYS